jgi:hypothetical protein
MGLPTHKGQLQIVAELGSLIFIVSTGLLEEEDVSVYIGPFFPYDLPTRRPISEPSPQIQARHPQACLITWILANWVD